MLCFLVSKYHSTSRAVLSYAVFTFYVLLVSEENQSFCILQQYQVIKDNTNLEVDEYYGAKGVDFWDAGTWEKEINQNDVSCFFFHYI